MAQGKISNSHFQRKVQGHVFEFMTKMRLLPKSGKVLVALSGGVDSIVLAHIAHNLLPNNEMELAHIIHGSHWKENLKAFKAVHDFAKSLKLKLHTKVIHLDLEAANFEHRARQERQSFFRNFTKQGIHVFQGHHLDDSFEWSLMAQFRSGNPGPSLGIPVFNNGVARPLLCLSRKTIEQYAKSAGLNFYSDPSNEKIKFDRNYVRKTLVPLIRKRYPQYLKHYVTRSNQSAQSMGVSRFQKGAIQVRTGSFGEKIFEIQGSLEGHEEELGAVIRKLSSSTRGSLSLEIRKLAKAFDAGKQGPFQFSGSVEVFRFGRTLAIYGANEMKKMRAYDRQAYLKLIDMGEVNDRPFPQIVLLRGGARQFNRAKNVHSLMPLSTQKCLEEGQNFDFFPNLINKSKALSKNVKRPSILVKGRWYSLDSLISEI